jgi:hypothetical protein
MKIKQTILILSSITLFSLSGCLGFGYETDSPGYVVEQPSSVIVTPEHRDFHSDHRDHR